MSLEKFIKNLTREAGERLFSYFKKENKLISLRGTSKEIVTRYDKIIDKFLIQSIKKEFPEHSILTEESGFITGKASDQVSNKGKILVEKRKEFLWIVDSLDGSSNFANKNPLFSVCICLCINNEPFLSSIYAPMIDEFYFAKKSGGAYLNGKRIKVSKINRLEESYVVYCEGNEKDKKRIANIFHQTYPKVKDLRKIGSAGIESAWVAAGRVDAFFTTKIDPWDVAAGVLLTQEAGGQISDFQTNSWQIKKSDLIFSNRLIHKNFQNYLKNS